MIFKLILAVIFFSALTFIAFRFGLLEPDEIGKQPTNKTTDIPLSPTLLPPSVTLLPTIKISTTSAKIALLEAPAETKIGQSFTIKWFVDNNKTATISHTAVHFGKTSNPYAKLPSDYPGKSAILKGAIPATFSAQLTIAFSGLYYYRAHAIVDNTHIWSSEKTIQIKPEASLSATPTP